MTYTIYNYRPNTALITGYNNGDLVTLEQINTLITEAKVNVMIQHVAAYGDKPATSYCYIDDLKFRFQQR